MTDGDGVVVPLPDASARRRQAGGEQRWRRSSSSPAPRRAADGETEPGGWERTPRRRTRVRAAPAERSLRTGRVRLRPRARRHRRAARLPAALREVLPRRGERHRERAAHRARAAGGQSRRWAVAVGRGDDRRRRPHRTPGGTVPAPARCRPALRDARRGHAGAPLRRDAGLPRRRRPVAARRRAGRRLARGVQGHRQALPRPLPAAALRTRRLRAVRDHAPGPRSSRSRSSARRRSTRCWRT